MPQTLVVLDFPIAKCFTNEVSSSSLFPRFSLEVEKTWMSSTTLVSSSELFLVARCLELSANSQSKLLPLLGSYQQALLH